MDLGYLSPSKLEAMRLCESRLVARVTEDDWEEEHGEGAAMGTLAHNGAKIWYRPNETWLSRVRQGDDPDLLEREAQAIVAQARNAVPVTQAGGGPGKTCRHGS